MSISQSVMCLHPAKVAIPFVAEVLWCIRWVSWSPHSRGRWDGSVKPLPNYSGHLLVAHIVYSDECLMTYRYSTLKALLIGMLCTLFDFFNIPVFWPILVLYFVILFTITMKKQIRVCTAAFVLYLITSRSLTVNEHSSRISRLFVEMTITFPRFKFLCSIRHCLSWYITNCICRHFWFSADNWSTFALHTRIVLGIVLGGQKIKVSARLLCSTHYYYYYNTLGSKDPKG